MRGMKNIGLTNGHSLEVAEVQRSCHTSKESAQGGESIHRSAWPGQIFFNMRGLSLPYAILFASPFLLCLFLTLIRPLIRPQPHLYIHFIRDVSEAGEQTKDKGGNSRPKPRPCNRPQRNSSKHIKDNPRRTTVQHAIVIAKLLAYIQFTRARGHNTRVRGWRR